MKKFYSFVLMAAALLIGTNAWGADITSASQLQEAINQAGLKKNVGTVKLKLGSDITIPTSTTIFLGTNGVDDDIKSIELDLNGYDIKMTTNYTSSDDLSNTTSAIYYMFVVSHGELLVCNNSSSKSQLILKGNTHRNSAIFYVHGSYKSIRWKKQGDVYVANDAANIINTRDKGYFTHLEIGENVELYADGCSGTGIVIDAVHGSTAPVAQASKPLAGKYKTDIFNSGYGLAQGVRVDIKGDIDFSNVVSGVSKVKSYGIKVNGNLWTTLPPKTGSARSLNSSFPTDPAYFTHFSGNRDAHAADTVDAPYVHIYKTATIKSNSVAVGDADNSTAVYVAGYGKVTIDGAYCQGNTALYASSGEITVHDATLHSDANEYNEPNGEGSANGGGSTLVVNSRDGYSGNMNITISGDTKITSNAGYAIEDHVSSENTGLEAINIEGGTFEGGDKGAIIVATENKTAVTVDGASWTGTIENVEVEDLLPKDGQGNPTSHITVVEVNGQPTFVVSKGEAPATADPDDPTVETTWEFINDNQGADKSYQWTAIENAAIPANATVILNELLINSGNDIDGNQQLTINDGATLQVERLTMNDYARIIVKAGGKLIVKGSQGIVAGVVENIKLENEENKPSIFLFNPAVTSNRHPKAQVEVYTNCYQMESSPKKIYVYQRLALPVMEGMKPTNDFNGSLFEGNSFTTYAWYWNGNIWASLSHWTDLKPFIGYEFANNATAGGVTYTFSGQLVGNGDAEYDFPTGGYDYFGCSHVAPIYADSLLKPFENSNMEATAWVWNFSTHNWNVINSENIKEGWAPAEIQPMTAFVLRLKGASGKAGMNYASAIWGNPNFDAILGRPSQVTPAPARNMVDDVTNRAMINVRAENGFGDAVKLIEKDYYTTEFDNGADASKFMCEDGINLYASTEAGDLACVATDNLMGTLLSFRSGSSTQYTINLSNVMGEEYALRDNVTGQVITFAEGATYTFTQEAYTTVPARFELVEAAKMPTAIENIEEVAKASGVYTMTGQYVGRDFTKLPAGVYVVNGVKIVK